MSDRKRSHDVRNKLGVEIALVKEKTYIECWRKHVQDGELSTTTSYQLPMKEKFLENQVEGGLKPEQVLIKAGSKEKMKKKTEKKVSLK